MADTVKKVAEKQGSVTKNEQWFTYKVNVEFLTPYIAPALSPNKFIRKLQIQDVIKCYSEEARELVEHIDRAFVRDSECNIVVPGHIFSGALRELLQRNDISVRGSITIKKEDIRIGTSKILTGSGGLMVYEYVPAGIKLTAELQLNTPMKEKEVIVINIGFRKYKGFGRVKLTFVEEVKQEQKGARP